MKKPTTEPARGAAAAFERRAARAELLASQSTAGEPLEFAAGLYRAQAELAAAVEAAPLGGSLQRDLPGFAAGLAGVLRTMRRSGPPGLSEQARARAGQEPSWLVVWWTSERSGRVDYLARALLRPYAEVLAARGLRPEPPIASGGCPFCGGAPWIAFRRADSGEAGAQRLLGCALCGGEWPVNRIHCAACGEESPDKLPMFQSDRHASVRLEACETCRSYVKSIDLTQDARAIPEVDDLVSLSMDLWAGEQGYARVEPSLAGI